MQSSLVLILLGLITCVICSDDFLIEYRKPKCQSQSKSKSYSKENFYDPDIADYDTSADKDKTWMMVFLCKIKDQLIDEARMLKAEILMLKGLLGNQAADTV